MNEPPAMADPFAGLLPQPSETDDLLPSAEPRSEDEGETPSTDGGRAVPFEEWAWQRLSAIRVETVISFVVVALSMVWIFSVLHPKLVFADTTPTGGDMGAHVWAPAFLRDHLIPHGRLIGWTSDWYDGFPAFQYYMILPSLAVVLLNVGLPTAAAIPVLLGAAGLTGWVFARPHLRRWRRSALIVAGFIALLSIGLPYGVSFKIVVISGLVTMPLNAWAMGKLSGMAFPGPVLLALATLPFVFDRSFNIYGGNIASTMAGEFAFSMALSLSMLAIGASIRAVDTGRGRGWAALLLALTGLCHLFPAFFALGIVLAYVALRFGRTQLISMACIFPVGGALGAFWALPFFAKRTYMNDMGWGKIFNFKANLLTRNSLPADFLRDSPPLEVVFAVAVVGLLLSIYRRNRLGIALAVGAAAVAWAFINRPEGRLWNGRMLPFYYLSLYLLAAIALAEAVQLVRERRWARWFASWALVGLVLAEIVRAVVANTGSEDRIGRVLPGAHASAWAAALLGLLAAALWSNRNVIAPVLAVVCGLVWMGSMALPEAWWRSASGAHGFINVAGETFARPITYAVLHALEYPAAYVLIGMVVIGLLNHAVDVSHLVRPNTGRAVQLASAPIVFLLVFAVFAPALRSVPFGKVTTKGTYEWGLPFWKHETKDINFLPGWAKWNFEGYERKPSSPNSGGYEEYYALVQMVKKVGNDPALGCGMSMWEYGPRLEGYGTPMAPMLLPMFTDGCIGSMEGLYFEASSTTPFHFLNQSALSKNPSSPQRDLPYPGFNVDLGVQQLELLGVRYYLAFSDEAVKAADQHPDLTPVAQAGVWHMYEVANSQKVVPLQYQPVVYSDVGETQKEWLQPAAKFFDDPSQWDVLRAASGPADWARFAIPETAKLTANELAAARAKADKSGVPFEDPTIPEPPRSSLPPVAVSNIVSGNNDIAFDVDKVGVPVLVKYSYFPNWKVSGGKGPYRVTPNLMVVIPTSNHVQLSYGDTGVDRVAMFITVMGLVALVWLFRRRPAPAVAPFFDPLGWIAAPFAAMHTEDGDDDVATDARSRATDCWPTMPDLVVEADLPGRTEPVVPVFNDEPVVPVFNDEPVVPGD